MTAATPQSTLLHRLIGRLAATSAAQIHERVIMLDSHIDFEPADLIGERNYTQRLETQFNLPNMIDGGARRAILRHLRRPDPGIAES